MDLAGLPHLGIGISAEFDSARTGIDALILRDAYPDLIDFLEYGADLARGLDDHARRWAEADLPATYHFLDLNLTEVDDADEQWLERTVAMAEQLGAAWLCGDGGLWHFGPRDRGHETLLPPILTRDSADEMAEAVAFVQDATNMLVLPENPPAAVYVGDMHILDYFARVADRTGGGVLLDCAHLAIYQRLFGHDPLTGLDAFPLDRIVEVHVAGGTERDTDGYAWVDDDHNPEPLPDTWQIFERIAAGAPNLKAVVYECERNAPGTVVDNFQTIRAIMDAGQGASV